MAALTLVVMAAGLGSRYGGLKQLEPVGPSGETLLDYSIHDALRAGFTRLVFVIRRNIEATFRQVVVRRYEKRAEVALVFQELSQVPAGFVVPTDRAKPWGTGHAALVAAGEVTTPCAVINADDFYGRDAFASLAMALDEDPAVHALVAYRLADTLSMHGAVARAVCRSESGWLTGIEEFTGIERCGDSLQGVGPAGVIRFTGDEPVSLNLWGFQPQVFPLIAERFEAFLRERGDDLMAEFYVPHAIGDLIRDGRIRVRLVPTSGRWFGITHREDAPFVRDRVRSLVAAGAYPNPLFSA
jgi:CTP:molybdopterin cytidylyltransferase MocA